MYISSKQTFYEILKSKDIVSNLREICEKFARRENCEKFVRKLCEICEKNANNIEKVVLPRSPTLKKVTLYFEVVLLFLSLPALFLSARKLLEICEMRNLRKICEKLMRKL